MTLRFIRKEKDKRGLRWFFSSGNKKISIFEIKKGFARGGQYHKNEVVHILISGRVEYTKENIKTQEKSVEKLNSPAIVRLPPYTSDLIIGLVDSVLIGIYDSEFEDRFFSKHRKIVKERMKNNFLT